MRETEVAGQGPDSETAPMQMDRACLRLRPLPALPASDVMALRTFVCLSLLCASAGAQENVMVLVLDDVGVDRVGV